MADIKPSKKDAQRLSAQQRQILRLLELGQAYPKGDDIAHLPRTGDIIDVLKRPRNPVSFASVSRALRLLEQAGLIVSYPVRGSRGQGRAYALARDDADG